jgi:hypothetical protein
MTVMVVKTGTLMTTTMMTLTTTNPPTASQTVEDVDKRANPRKEPPFDERARKRSRDLFCVVMTGNVLWMGSVSFLREKIQWPSRAMQSKQAGAKLAAGLAPGSRSSSAEVLAIFQPLLGFAASTSLLSAQVMRAEWCSSTVSAPVEVRTCLVHRERSSSHGQMRWKSLVD